MKNKTMFAKQNMNFFDALRRYERAEEKPEKRSVLFPVLLLCVALAFGGGIYLFGEKSRELDEATAVLQNYVGSQANINALQDRSRLRQDVSFLAAYNAACKKHIEYLHGAYRLSSGDFAAVEGEIPADTTILEYQLTEGELSVFCETTDKSAPSRFAEKLTGLKAFQAVTYEGFAAADSEKATYTFTIKCRLW